MKKKIVSIILVFGMMLGLAGCNAITIDGEGETVENAGNGTIGLSVSTLNNPFFCGACGRRRSGSGKRRREAGGCGCRG